MRAFIKPSQNGQLVREHSCLAKTVEALQNAVPVAELLGRSVPEAVVPREIMQCLEKQTDNLWLRASQAWKTSSTSPKSHFVILVHIADIQNVVNLSITLKSNPEPETHTWVNSSTRPSDNFHIVQRPSESVLFFKNLFNGFAEQTRNSESQGQRGIIFSILNRVDGISGDSELFSQVGLRPSPLGAQHTKLIFHGENLLRDCDCVYGQFAMVSSFRYPPNRKAGGEGNHHQTQGEHYTHPKAGGSGKQIASCVHCPGGNQILNAWRCGHDHDKRQAERNTGATGKSKRISCMGGLHFIRSPKDREEAPGCI